MAAEPGHHRPRPSDRADRPRARGVPGQLPASADAFAAAGNHLLGGVPMTWMRMWSGGFPLYHATASGARLTDIDGHEFIDFCLGDTGGDGRALARRGAGRRLAPVRRARRGHDHAAHAGRGVGRGRAHPALRRGSVELHADRYRRQPLGDPAGPAAHPAAEDRRVQLLLPRQRRRDVHRRDGRRPAVPGRQRGRAGRSARDDQGGGVQRPRRAGTGAVARRRRGRAHGARADQHRHRAAGGRVPGRRPRADPPARHLADQRRDAHVQRRARRLHRRVGPGAGHGDDRQVDRRRRPGRRLRPHRRPGRADPRRPGRGHRGHRRRRRHAGRQRPVASPPCGPPSARC